MIIGITGTYAAGKDTVGQILVEKGFKHYSLSDELREILKEKNIPVTRDNLIAMGTKLRADKGTGYLSQKVLSKIGSEKAVVTSIRNIGEIDELKKDKNFILLAVDAPPEIRFNRSQKRRRGEEEGKTIGEFLAKEKSEMATSGAGQQLGLCIQAADYKIINDGTAEELQDKVNQLLKIVERRRGGK